MHRGLGTLTYILHRGHTRGHRSSHTHHRYCITQHVTLHSHRKLHRPLHSQGQHKCHTDPADHTHIRSRSRTTEHCTHIGNCTVKAVHSHTRVHTHRSSHTHHRYCITQHVTLHSHRKLHRPLHRGNTSATQIDPADHTHIAGPALVTEHCTHAGNCTERYTHTYIAQGSHKWT